MSRSVASVKMMDLGRILKKMVMPAGVTVASAQMAVAKLQTLKSRKKHKRPMIVKQHYVMVLRLMILVIYPKMYLMTVNRLLVMVDRQTQ